MTIIDRLTEGMTAARDHADGQERPDYIILPRADYEKLYYAAHDAKRILVALKGAL
jgi:hypothetical protein